MAESSNDDKNDVCRVAQSDEIRVAQSERPKCEECVISGCCLKWCVWCCPKWCGCPQYWDTRSIIQCLISCSFNHLDLALKPSLNRKISKVTFPNLPPAQGYASPSRKLVLPQIDHNYTVGVIYVYICIDCQSSILSHMVPELINNLICWNCKGCIGKSIGPVQYRFTIPSLLAQCHVAGSMPRCWLSAS